MKLRTRGFLKLKFVRDSMYTTKPSVELAQHYLPTHELTVRYGMYQHRVLVHAVCLVVICANVEPFLGVLLKCGRARLLAPPRK